MKTLAKLAILVAVLAFCLPAYSEILIYEYSSNGDYYGRRNGVWEVEIEDDRGYLVIEVMYNTDGTIELNQALYIEYWGDNEGKWFRVVESGFDLEIERVEYGGEVQWLFLERDVEETEIHLMTIAGKAYNQDIGKEDKREVATKLNGYDLEVQRDPMAERFYCEMEEVTAALHSRWTKYANDDEKGLAQNYAATVQYVKDELQKQGYQEVTELFAVLLDSILSPTWYTSWWDL